MSALLFLRLLSNRQREEEDGEYRRYPPSPPLGANPGDSSLPPPTVVSRPSTSRRSRSSRHNSAERKYQYLPVFLVTAIVSSVLIIGFALYDVVIISKYFEDFAQAQSLGKGAIRHQDIHKNNVSSSELPDLHTKYERQRIMAYLLIVLQLVLLSFACLGFAVKKYKNRKLLLPWLFSCFPVNAYAMVYSVSFTASSQKSLVYLKVLIVVIVFTLTANLFRLVYRIYRKPSSPTRRRRPRTEQSSLPLPTVFKGEIQLTPPPYEKDPPPYEAGPSTSYTSSDTTAAPLPPYPGPQVVLVPENASSFSLADYRIENEAEVSLDDIAPLEESEDDSGDVGCTNSAFVRNDESVERRACRV